ncbi:MAG: response regulator [Cyanobacteria bacterium P01_E01_bin.42]
MGGTAIESNQHDGLKSLKQSGMLSDRAVSYPILKADRSNVKEIGKHEISRCERTIEKPENNSFKSQLKRLQQQRFTGRLDIDVQGQQWCLYLSLGRIAWATGGVHPGRRWRRQLLRTGMTQRIQVKGSDRYECWDYELLTLLSHKKLINKEQQMTILRGTVAEILFEILQAIDLASSNTLLSHDLETTDEEHLPFTLTPRLGVRPSNSDTGIFPRDWTIEIESALAMTERAWESWVKAGFRSCSPNLAPVLKNPVKLQEQVSPKIYQHLAELVNGKRTLRDLTLLMKKDLLGLIKLLCPYLRTHALGFAEIADSAVAPAVGKPVTPTSERGDRGTILCIDDSVQVRKIMDKLLTNAGYRVVTVEEAIQALPTLLECNPDAIFLDLMMPIANGYEICTQIRRIDRFKEIPIIILTGNDGLVDRVRAKVVGATNFLSKPIKRDRILAVASQYVENKQSIRSH